MVNAGYVYILTNRSFPEYVKIGYADDVQKRLKELNRSECIPYAFRIYATYGVNERLTDKALHKMIDSLDPTLRAVDTFDGKPRKKEFYAMTPDKAYDILKTIARVSSTMNRLRKYSQDGQEILDDQTAVAVEEATTYDESSHLVHGLPSTRELYSDSDPNRCYYFRIRSRFDDKGELVEAYYGKVYGDFNFHGDWSCGFQGFDFLHYLNPKSLDRNLEWDMKNNLCPNPGSLGQLQP